MAQRGNGLPHSWFSSAVHDWQHGTTQHSLLIHTHQSYHYVLKQCRVGGESCQSSPAGKKCRKTCSDRQQLLPPRHHCLHSVVNWSFENSGAATESGCFLPSFHLLTSLSCVIGCLTTSFVGDGGGKESTGCAKCQPDAEVPLQGKSSSPGMNENLFRKLPSIYYHSSYNLFTLCWQHS